MGFDRDTSIHTQVSEHVSLSCFCLDIFSNALLCQTSGGRRRSEDSPVYFPAYSFVSSLNHSHHKFILGANNKLV